MNFAKTFLAAVLAFFVGNVLVSLFWLVLVVGIASLFSSDSSVTVGKESILKIDLSETIVDAPSTDPLAGFDFRTFETQTQLPILKTLRALDAAKEDDRIKGIYLRLNGGGGIMGSALVEELREAIVDFKSSGKFVVAYNETYSQGQYYLASAADEIYMQPAGGMDWTGLSMNLMFYKGLFDKLDLRAEIFRPTVCKYKSAVEPYFLTRMSDANRQQMQELVNSMWRTISGGVAASRGIAPEELNRLADGLEVVLPEDAVKYGLVDELLYEDQMDEVFARLGVEADDEGRYAFVTLGEYAAQLAPEVKKLTAPQVAVVYAEGQIVDGEGYGSEIYGNTLAAKLAEVREDEDVAAVVMRVNSPGGSALASDVVWREMQLLKAEKPVVVSMGSYAASGGYYISCPADVIMADRMTLTGSIGVFGMYLYTVDALKNKLGITIDGVKSNASADMGQTKPLTPAEKASIMRGVDKVYETFTSYVAAGRNLPIERVLEIAGGRVWTGEDALGIGLVDGYGGLKAAIAQAVDKADLGDDYRVVEKLETPTGLAAFMASLNVSVRQAFVRSELESVMKEYAAVREAIGQQGILMYSPYKLELR